MRKVTFEEFLKRAREKYGDRFVYDESSYKSITKPMTFYDTVTEKTYTQYANVHLNRSCCKALEREENLREWFKQLQEMYSDRFELSYDKVFMKGYENFITFTDKESGKEYTTRISSLLKDILPAEIRGGTSPAKAIIRKLYEKFPSYSFELTQGGEGSNQDIKITCLEHGDCFRKYRSINAQGYLPPCLGCLKEIGIEPVEEGKRREHFEWFVSKCKETHGDRFEYFYDDGYGPYQVTVKDNITGKTAILRGKPAQKLRIQVPKVFSLSQRRDFRTKEELFEELRTLRPELTFPDSQKKAPYVTYICPQHGKRASDIYSLRTHGCDLCHREKFHIEGSQEREEQIRKVTEKFCEKFPEFNFDLDFTEVDLTRKGNTLKLTCRDTGRTYKVCHIYVLQLHKSLPEEIYKDYGLISPKMRKEFDTLVARTKAVKPDRFSFLLESYRGYNEPLIGYDHLTESWFATKPEWFLKNLSNSNKILLNSTKPFKPPKKDLL